MNTVFKQRIKIDQSLIFTLETVNDRVVMEREKLNLRRYSVGETQRKWKMFWKTIENR